MSAPVRPTSYAGWASGPSGYVTEPIAADKAQGFLPTGPARSSYYNWLQNANYQWQQYLDQKIAAIRFGDGRDGDCVLVGPTQISRDMFYNNFTATGPNAQLQVNGPSGTYRIRVKNRLTANGPAQITANGYDAVSSTGATGILDGTVAGNATGAAVGASGLPITNSFGGYGGTGGTGAGQQGSGSTALLPTPTLGAVEPVNPLGHLVGGGSVALIRGGGAGGGGGGALGGGGGAGGGVLCIAARELAISTGTALMARGGAGGVSQNSGNSGGGGGGGGGVLWLEYLIDLVGVGFTGPINCPGGSGASGHGAGGFGSTGLPGSVYLFQHTS